MTRSFVRRGLVAALAVSLSIAAGGCDAFGRDDGDPTPAAPGTPSAAAPAFDSQFTRDGTFQSHIELPEAPGIDFVYTLYPTKSTPRTNEWYPKGSKFFSFTFQAYDLTRDLRDPFKTKRKVWLSHITVTSSTTTSDGGPPEAPYSLDAVAAKTTFDPQPLTSKHGMLITSPKGAFELRNQEIGTLAPSTIGVTLTLSALVSVETEAGSGKYVPMQVVQQVPIAIFPSEKETVVSEIPVDAN
ncbi:MAG TPA: hypothetical protein PK324_12050 [Nocardioides sp.]|nr:hypothetical protein [Nocardioides sp.]